MSDVQNTLWRSCRVLAGETRIRLLWEIFSGGDRPIYELARSVGISESNASIQLQELSLCGLIVPVRNRMRIIYRAAANPEVESAQELLSALRACYDKGITVPKVLYAATAFTHERRIIIAKRLSGSPKTSRMLEQETGIDQKSLLRHLRKLKDRGLVSVRGKRYVLSGPRNPLGKCLLNLVCS